MHACMHACASMNCVLYNSLGHQATASQLRIHSIVTQFIHLYTYIYQSLGEMRFSSIGALCSAVACFSLVRGYIGMSSFLCRNELMIVPISDTDQLRETCAGMFGGDEAFIEGMSER